MADYNKNSYKRLKAKVSNKRTSTVNFKQKVANLNTRMFPNTSKAPKKESKGDYDSLLKNLQTNYDTKLEALKDEYSGRIAQSEAANAKEIERLTSDVKKEQGKANDITDGIREAVSNIYKEKEEAQRQAEEQQQVATKATTPDIADNTIIDIKGSSKRDIITEKKEEDVVEDIKDKKEDVTENVIKKSLNIGDSITMGDNFYYKATNLYGPRSGANYVAGREAGEHSRGVDLVLYNKDNTKSNLPMVVAGGVIKKIWLQGSGSSIKPHQGKAAGWVVEVETGGKIISYTHLSPDVKNLKVGTQVSRGDLLSQDPTFTGSGTAPHVKIMMSDMNDKGTSARNYTDKGNDPTSFILNGV